MGVEEKTFSSNPEAHEPDSREGNKTEKYSDKATKNVPPEIANQIKTAREKSIKEEKKWEGYPFLKEPF